MRPSNCRSPWPPLETPRHADATNARPAPHPAAHRHGECARRTAGRAGPRHAPLRGPPRAAPRAAPPLARLLQRALVRCAGGVEDVNFRVKRGLDRSVFLRLAAGDWLRQHEVVLVVGPTGTGKTWLACALGHSACRQGASVRYVRLPRLLGDLALAPGAGPHGRPPPPPP